MKKEEYIRRYGIEKYEESLKKHKEYMKGYTQKHKEEIKEYLSEYRSKHREILNDKKHQYYIDNKEKIQFQKKEYRKKNKEEIRLKKKAYYAKNQEHIQQHKKQYYQENRDSCLERSKKQSKTLPGRANRLVQGYKWTDIRYDREGFDLTSEWVIDNILTKACIYCGETDWTKLGCDRIDNEKAHSMENCVCSCRICNQQRYYEKMSVEEFILHRKHHRSEPLS